MRMKIISIVFCVLLIVTATLPALGTISSPTKSTIDRKELKVYANRMDYSQKEEMSITVENTGAETVLFNVFPKVEIFDEQGVKVFPTYMEEGEWFLRPGEKETYVWDQKDRDGQLVDEGKVTIQTVSELVVEPIFEPFIFDIGYVILVAGDDFVHDHRCFDGPREIYDDLIDMGFTDSKIQFLNDVNYGSDPKVDDIASAETVEEAITVWAASRVSLYSPLYIIMFDHGWINSFSVENDVGGDNVYASDLRSWIDTLYDGTSARIDVWIMACRSGSFIDDLSRDGYITITSTCESLNTAAGPAPYYEHFTGYFWPKVKCGYTWGEAFNYACYHAHEAASKNIPLLDDNGDGVGHGVYDCSGVYEGYLPHSGDGSVAMHLHMGDYQKRCIFQLIHWLIICQIQFIPDTRRVDTIPLWAVIDTEEQLDNVSACMLDPNYVCEGCFDEMAVEYYKMNDDDGDGKWTVDIPIEEFKKHDATDFTFLINAKTKDGESTIPMQTKVYLRQGFEDREKPFINIDNPRDGQVVGGLLNIKGRVSDNMEIMKIIVYLGNDKIEEIDPEPCGHYYFDTTVDLDKYPVGKNQVQVIAYDKYENMNMEVRDVMIVGPPSKPDTPSGPLSGKVGSRLTFTTLARDPQQDRVFYQWDWGDGESNTWVGPYDSGLEIETTHIWSEEGTYQIRVKAKDIYGAEGPWSDPLQVSIPRDKAVNRPILNLLNSHPNMFPLLQKLLQQLGLF
jgi:hypothetical protein